VVASCTSDTSAGANTSTGPSVNVGRAGSDFGASSRDRAAFLAASTSGWSNGLIPSSRPTIAVAYSHSRNWPPSAPSMPISAPCVASPMAIGVASDRASVNSGSSGFSTTTGSRPVPFLPVDSAMSCSAQSPKPLMPEPVSAMTTFSAPRACAPPSAAASTSAGLSALSTAR
jgi:hypothetical protein